MIVEHEMPFSVGMDAVLDRHGRECRVVVVKATFQILDGGRLMIAEKQAPLLDADIHFGDPCSSSIKFESDGAFYKPATDIVVVGSAWAPNLRPTPAMRAGLRVGKVQKSVAVFGDRTW